MFKIKSLVPRYRPLTSIGYKYNEQKVISFIDTEDTGITKSGILYLSHYPYPFANFSILLVPCPLIMSKFF